MANTFQCKTGRMFLSFHAVPATHSGICHHRTPSTTICWIPADLWAPAQLPSKQAYIGHKDQGRAPDTAALPTQPGTCQNCPLNNPTSQLSAASNNIGYSYIDQESTQRYSISAWTICIHLTARILHSPTIQNQLATKLTKPTTAEQGTAQGVSVWRPVQVQFKLFSASCL